MLDDLRHHFRVLLAFGLGLAVGFGIWWVPMQDRLLLFSFSFSLAYLVLTAALMPRITGDFLRGRADIDDEGMWLIVPIAVASVTISFYAILLTIRDPHSGLVLRPYLALLSVPLGWVTIHTIMGFHYAGLWYAKGPHGRERRNLDFPGLGPTQDARIWDFLYFSFVLGMTAQTADVSTLDTRVRRVVLLHSAFAFYYNTVLLALAVNAGMSLGQ